MGDAANIFNTTKRVINKAKAGGVTTAMAANRLAEERIESVGRLQRMRV